MSWSEKQKYMHWKNQGYTMKDMTTPERDWYTKMEKKYNPEKNVNGIKKDIKTFTPKKKKRFNLFGKNPGQGKRGRRILDNMLGV